VLYNILYVFYRKKRRRVEIISGEPIRHDIRKLRAGVQIKDMRLIMQLANDVIK